MLIPFLKDGNLLLFKRKIKFRWEHFKNTVVETRNKADAEWIFMNTEEAEESVISAICASVTVVRAEINV